MYNYNDITVELTSNNVVPAIDIFDYQTDQIDVIYDRYFQYCQKCLTEYSNDYAIQPAKIYFYNDYSVNAAAGYINNYYLVRINMGMIDILYNLFHANNEQFDKPETERVYGKLASSFDAPLGYIMFQFATYFTFYHERAHLIQKSPLLYDFLTETNLGPGIGYSGLSHSLEFDADLHAAHSIVFIILEYWAKLSSDNHNSEYANEILSLAMSSIFIKFMLFEQNYNDIYYKAGTHPHPVIRITYILDIMVGVAEQNFNSVKLDAKKIINQCFKICTSYCQTRELRDAVKAYADMLFKEYKNIESFINDTIIPESDLIPCLVKNRN